MEKEITFKCPGCKQSFTEMRPVYPDDYEFPKGINVCVPCFQESLSFPPEDSFLPLPGKTPKEEGTFEEREYKRIERVFDEGRTRKKDIGRR